LSYLEIRGLSKRFGPTRILNRIDCSVERGELVTLLGPSGCGKTTLLRCVAGLERPDEGAIFAEGEDLTDRPPQRRNIGMVFQSYALFPNLNVFDNAAFGLSMARVPREETRRRVEEVLRMVEMEDYRFRRPSELSGGQRQRVALARALAPSPRILLLDEPLSALDARIRRSLREQIRRIQRETGLTTLFVTHDQEEALTMSDTIVVMNEGRIQQVGDPKRIYDEPKNAFVAEFIGESNILHGVMLEDELVEMCGEKFPCVDSGFARNQPVDVVVRPEDIMVVGEDVGMLTGEVKSVLFKGVHYEMIISAGGFDWKVHSTTMQPAGSTVGLSIVPFNIHIMRKQPKEEGTK